MSKIKFYHGTEFRLGKLEVLLSPANQIVAAGDVIGIPVKIPRITICGIFDEDKKTLSFGVARCATKDTFKKSIGREISFQRALQSPYKVVSVPDNVKLSKVFVDNCVEIEAEVQCMQAPIKLQ